MIVSTFRSNKIKVVLFIILSLVIAFFFSFVLDSVTKNIIKRSHNVHGSSNENKIQLENAELIGIAQNEKGWIATEDNPEIIIRDIDTQVEYIEIRFTDGESWRTGAMTNWNYDQAQQMDDHMTTGVDSYGEPYLLLGIADYVHDAKIILEIKAGRELAIESIVINPDLSIQLKDNLRRAFIFRFNHSKRYVEKFKIIWAFLLLLGLLNLVGWSRSFDFRWYIGAMILLFLVANNYNGDSLGCYDYYIAGEGSEFVSPIIGQPRHIRSDEWVEHSTTFLSTRYLESIYEKNNYIIRGADTINEYAITWYSFSDPFNFVSAFLQKVIGFERAYSFRWYSRIIFTFLINIEFFLILTKGKRLLSLASTSMITLSSFFLWWYFPAFVTAVPAMIVAFHKFIKCEKYAIKLLCSFMFCAFCGLYVFNLYPAWQVPIGYLIGVLLLDCVFDNIEAIKKFKSLDWIVVFGSIILFGIMVVGFVVDRRAYIDAMLNTVYPGKRVFSGGFSLEKSYNYFLSPLFSYVETAYNASNESICISLFPLPIIAAIVYQIHTRFRNRTVNILLLYSAFLLLFTMVRVPETMAKVTLMSYTTGSKAVEVLSYSEVILFSVVFSVWEEKDKVNTLLSSIFAVLFSGAGVFLAASHLPDYMSSKYIIFVLFFFSLVVWLLIVDKSNTYMQMGLLLLICFCFFTGIYVRPISKGLDSIYSKPLYKEVRAVVENDPKAKWISQGLCMCNYLVACGAPSIDFCNTYPNYGLWSSLDESGYYSDCYNRFFHPMIYFTDQDTCMSNPQVDIMLVYLSYRDLKKTDVKYIASSTPLSIDNDYVRFEPIYEGEGFIYSVKYKQYH